MNSIAPLSERIHPIDVLTPAMSEDIPSHFAALASLMIAMRKRQPSQEQLLQKVRLSIILGDYPTAVREAALAADSYDSGEAHYVAAVARVHMALALADAIVTPAGIYLPRQAPIHPFLAAAAKNLASAMSINKSDEDAADLLASLLPFLRNGVTEPLVRRMLRREVPIYE